MWHSVGTHIATTHSSSTPSNISDGFYIPLLDSLTKLLENKHVYQQVSQSHERGIIIIYHN